MKRSNRTVLAPGRIPVVVASCGSLAVGAPLGSATAWSTASAPAGAGITGPDTDQPILADRLAILGTLPQQAELIRFAQLDTTFSLLLRSPQDAAPAEVTTTWVTHCRVVDERGVLPPRVVQAQHPWTLPGTERD